MIESPQKEHGYTPIANQIMDALICSKISGQELRIVLLIIRKTYGFNKKEDTISLSQMANATGFSIGRCSQIINHLEDKQIITLSENIQGVSKTYLFNKHFTKWTPYHKSDTISLKRLPPYQKNAFRPYHKSDSTKDINNTKDTLTKDIIYLTRSKDFQLAFESFIEMRKKIRKPPTTHGLNLLVKSLDKITADEKMQIDIINISTMKCWLGFFAPKNGRYYARENSAQQFPRSTEQGKPDGGGEKEARHRMLDSLGEEIN